MTKQTIAFLSSHIKLLAEYKPKHYKAEIINAKRLRVEYEREVNMKTKLSRKERLSIWYNKKNKLTDYILFALVLAFVIILINNL